MTLTALRSNKAVAHVAPLKLQSQKSSHSLSLLILSSSVCLKKKKQSNVVCTIRMRLQNFVGRADHVDAS